MFTIAPSDWIQFSKLHINQDSARNDNTERDSYRNQNAKFNYNVQDFTIAMDWTDYNYGYDNCYDENFSQSNNCVQDGQKYMSIEPLNNDLIIDFEIIFNPFFLKTFSA